MKRQRLRNTIVFVFALWYHFGFAQDLNVSQEKYLEEMVETISESTEEVVDVNALIDRLGFYLSCPLNINSSTAEQLSELHLLNDFQIAVIIDYRKRNGDINTISELLYLPGFRMSDIELLKNFIVFTKVEKNDQINKDILKNSRHQFVFRYQRVLEKQKGYERIPDSILANDPDKQRYLGSPDKLHCRYSGSFGNRISCGIIMEKDAGEEFFRGSNRYGFDFYSGHISFNKEQGLIQNIIVGDYLVQWGQGLLIRNAYSFGKSSNPSDIVYASRAIRGNFSVNENGSMRGASITLKKGRFRYIAFYSVRLIDANIEDASDGAKIFTGSVETGYHATPSEIRKEKSLLQTSFGSSLQYFGNHLKAGLNGYHLAFEKDMVKSDDLYKAHSYSGSKLSGVSIDYKYLAGEVQIFGETAYSNSSVASLNGILLMPRSEIQIGIIHRYYQEGYYSFYANAFSENSCIANENGLYLGVDLQISDYRLRIYGDIFSFPWLKYRVNAPSEGYESFIELSRRFGQSDIYIRYRREEKPENYPGIDKQFELKMHLKENFRLNTICYAGENVRFQNRFEMVKVAFRGDKSDLGFLLSQDIVCNQKKVSIQYSLRIAYFNASAYNARIYAYERDILYAFSSYMHYGKGWRLAAMVKWEPAGFLTFWLRISQSVYPGLAETGSGLNAISENHKTELKFQTIVKF